MINRYRYTLVAITLLILVLACRGFCEIGANLPYKRYEAEFGSWGLGAVLHKSKDFIQDSTASEASNQCYVGLLEKGSYLEWVIKDSVDGVNIRFTLPDSPDGNGVNGLLGVYVNGEKVTDVVLTSYWAWQYFESSDPSNVPSRRPRMRFDEVHFKLEKVLNPGDTLRFVKIGDDSYEYGIDFVELEKVPPEIPKPDDALSVTDFGATPDDGNDDWSGFCNCINTAGNRGKNVYIPKGKYLLGKRLDLNVSDIKIIGAGIWYTEIYFTNNGVGGGGILGTDNCSKVEIAHMYLNSVINSRFYNDDPRTQYVYKCFMGTFGDNSIIHDIWEEHFECGFWIGDYSYPLSYTENFTIYNCRIRNNYADGVNFTQGTSNSVVRNCNIRNNGDDGLACWPSDYNSVKMSVNVLFENNTIEHNWRAGGIAIFGGDGHIIRNNLVKDNFAGSGIRLTTDFDGYNFRNTSNITFENNLIIHCGTSDDLWGIERGAVELAATRERIKNVNFKNLTIIGAQRDGIMIGGNAGFSGIYFENVIIDSTGLDPYVDSRVIEPHEGKAIVVYTNVGEAEISGLTISNIESEDPIYVKKGFDLKIRYANIPLEDIRLDPKIIKLPRLRVDTISVNPVPQYASNYSINWELADTNIAVIIDTNNVYASIMGKLPGSTYLIAQTPDGLIEDTCIVDVVPAVNIYSPDQFCYENGDSVIVIVDALGIDRDISVEYSVGGSATINEDFIIIGFTDNIINLNPSKYADTLVLKTVDDELREGPEYIGMGIVSNDNYTIGGRKNCKITILDDDMGDLQPPVIGITRTPCIIDGNIDPMWSNTPPMPIGNVVIGERQDDFYAEWRAMADETNLYILVNVKDSVLINDSGSNWWEDDAIEVFIDGDNSKGTSYDGINDFQYGFRWGDSSINIGANSLNKTDGIDFFIKGTKDGYILELLIPWQTVGVIPDVGDVIGFDIGVDDDDNGEARESQIVSLAKNETGWRNPSVLGEVCIGISKDNIDRSSKYKLSDFKISKIYPNPFNYSTCVEYYLPYKSSVVIKIYNVKGQMVRRISCGEKSAGVYKSILEAKGLSSGLYFAVVETAFDIRTEKILLIK
ncbi:MAG: right-handed parallel beta-helix repeat-containing protein [Candidatus Marinimicrobia bacterium]|nr:right-handed parallel beta-helix repeat-containing protein [Candidatus Neomarinimicrobiota bacterium]